MALRAVSLKQPILWTVKKSKVSLVHGKVLCLVFGIEKANQFPNLTKPQSVNNLITWLYYMTCVCSRYNARSDWLILVYSPVMLTGQLRACKSQAKSYIINNLLGLINLERLVYTGKFQTLAVPY